MGDRPKDGVQMLALSVYTRGFFGIRNTIANLALADLAEYGILHCY